MYTYALLPILCPSQWAPQARARLHQLPTVAGSRAARPWCRRLRVRPAVMEAQRRKCKFYKQQQQSW